MTKIADSYFIDSDTGKRIPVRMEYTGVFKPDTTMITAHNVYRLNNGVAEKLDRSGWRQPNTDDPNYWKTNIRQAAKNQEEPLNSVKYYWNKFTNWIKEDKNGGNMNCASYLQGGGVTPLNAAPLVSKEDIAEIITAALNGTGEIKQQATAALQEMMQDASIAPLVEQVMSEMGIPSLKCGGRVKKKALGSKITTKKIMAKGGCPCMIKKVGGRLIEVDSCTGLPVHKSGGQVMKFQNPALALTGERNITKRYLLSDGKYRVNPTTGAMEVNDQGSWLEALYQNLKNTETLEQLKKLLQQRVNDLKNFINVNGYLVEKPEAMGYTAAPSKKGYYFDTNGLIYKVANGQWVQLEMTKNSNGSYTNALGENVWRYGNKYITAPSGMGYTQRADGKWYDWEGNQMKITQDGWVLAGPSLPQVNEYGQTLGSDNKYSGTTYGQRNAAAVGMLGADGKTGMTVEERQAWMNGAGKDYLAQLNGGKGLGFTSAEYTGTAAQNRALFDAYKGFQNWSNAQASPVYTNLQLLNLDQAGVTGLSADDKARYDRLQAYQANRNKALTFKGTLYADELAYNTAVNTANQTAANKYYADLAQQQNAYNGNRAMATAALSSGVQKRRQAAFDNLSALNSDTLDYSKLSYRDIRDMQRQMRRGRRNGLYGNSEEVKEFYAAPGTGMLVPTMAKTYEGPAALTQEQLSATSFKNGGQLNYSNYLN